MVVDPRAPFANPEVCDGCTGSCGPQTWDFFADDGEFVGSSHSNPPRPRIPYAFFISGVAQPSSSLLCPAPARACGYAPYAPTTFVSVATNIAGDLDVLVLDDREGLWRTVRRADGQWSDAWEDVQQQIRDHGHPDVGPTKFVASATNDVGDLHVLVVSQRDGLWHTMWRTNDGWSDAWEDVQQQIRDHGHPDVGPTKFVASATNDVGDLHVLVLDERDGLWHTTWHADGGWTDAWEDVQQHIRDHGHRAIGPTRFVATARSGGTDLHVLAVSDRDGLWHTMWHANGGWSDSWGDVRAAISDDDHPDIGPIPFVAVATDDASDLHVLALDTTNALWHTIRYVDGSWPDGWGNVQAQFQPRGRLPRGGLPSALGPTWFVSAAADLHPHPEGDDPQYGDNLHIMVLDSWTASGTPSAR